VAHPGSFGTRGRWRPLDLCPDRLIPLLGNQLHRWDRAMSRSARRRSRVSALRSCASTRNPSAGLMTIRPA